MIGAPLDDLADHSALLMRRAVLRDDWISDTLLDLAAADRVNWTPSDWDTLLKDLQSSTLTVGEWLTIYT